MTFEKCLFKKIFLFSSTPVFEAVPSSPPSPSSPPGDHFNFFGESKILVFESAWFDKSFKNSGRLSLPVCQRKLFFICSPG